LFSIYSAAGRSQLLARWPGTLSRYGARMHECPVCRKVLPSKDNLMRHFRQHTGERPYSCPDCGRTFVDQGNTKKHSLVHRRPRFVDASRLPPGSRSRNRDVPRLDALSTSRLRRRLNPKRRRNATCAQCSCVE